MTNNPFLRAVAINLPDDQVPDGEIRDILDDAGRALISVGYYMFWDDKVPGAKKLIIGELKPEYRVRNHNIRGAGRKSKDVGGLTCGAVREMLRNDSARNVAATLGISRATLFRRLKNEQGSKDSGDLF